MQTLPGTIYVYEDYRERDSFTLFVKLKDIDEVSFLGAIIHDSITRDMSSSKKTRRFYYDSQENIIKWFQQQGHQKIIADAFSFPVPYRMVVPVEQELNEEDFLALYVPDIGYLESYLPYDRRKEMTEFLLERQEFLRHMLSSPYYKPKPQLFL